MGPVRVGFVGDRWMFDDGTNFWVDHALGRLIDALRARGSEFSLALASAPVRRELFSYPVQLPRDHVFPLPHNPGIARGFFNVRGCLHAIRQVERRSDIVIVQLPFSAGLALLRPKTPRVYQVCANVRTIVSASSYYRGLKGIPAHLGSIFIDRLQAGLIDRDDARFVAHGRELWNRHGTEQGRAVVSSVLLGDEIMSVPRSRPKDAPFRVLFVGYLRHEKGIDVLLAAFRKLLDQVPRAELHIVGAANTSDQGVGRQLGDELRSLEQAKKVVMIGPKTFGPDLFEQFANADVLAVPSRSEGTPRVLVEARAFGCPVVGTRVGGIPTSIEHEVDGLLVEPNDSDSLAQALLRLHQDPELRERLVRGGIARARRTTVDALAESIWQEGLRLLVGSSSTKGEHG